jgi:hypothetical protein
MHSESRHQATEDESLTRRRFVRGAAAAATAAPLAAGSASAQEGKVQKAALPNTAPKFGSSNYAGMFVKITGYDRDAEMESVGACDFVGRDEDLSAYAATLVDRQGSERESGETTLYGVTSTDAFDAGKVFVVNDTQSCPNAYTTVMLEEVDESSIEVSTGEEGGTGTSSSVPGFGLFAGALGVGTAAAAVAVRARDGDE